MVMSNEFWQGKRVFITGHTGFKGSWLTTWLKLLGANVVGYSLAAQSAPNLFSQAKVYQDMESIEGNILDKNLLFQHIAQAKPEIVFHLAAQPLVHYSYENPLETYTVNVIGTANVLEAIRHINSVRSVIVVTSDKCYENQEWVWGYRETDTLGGHDPYSNSKACAELVVSAYRKSYFPPTLYTQHNVSIATVRAGNVIGGGDWAAQRLIPDLVRSFMNNQQAMIRNPYAYRPWQYILDLLYGYLILAQKLYSDGIIYGEAWNFGPTDGNIQQVAYLADKIVNLWGDGMHWLTDTKGYSHEAKCLKLDCGKTREGLGWMPKMTIDQTLEFTIHWYKAYEQQQNMALVTIEEINRYQSFYLSNS
jgi:CDP-glucose 4,6-dehydratase